MAAPSRSLAARAGLIAATAGGIALAVWLVRRVGWDDVLAAGTRMGAWGFALFCLCSFGTFVLLGGAWQSAAHAPARRIPIFAGARVVREAVADFLPLSQLGGMAAGARILRVRGVPAARVYASMIVDQATEMASQLLITLFGVAAAASLLFGEGGAAIRSAVLLGTLALTVAVLAFILSQRRFVRVAAALARRILPGAAAALDEVDADLERLYAHRGYVVGSFLWNVAAWLAAAASAWLVLHLIGHPLAFWKIVSIESLIAVVRSVAFAVPGAIGFQEAAYAALGPLFGLPTEAALALSLARRARDVVVAMAAMVVWQWVEARAYWGRGTATASHDTGA